MTQSSEKKLKVVLLNHSDNNGGAAVVTYRLMYALRKQGVDASMLVYTNYTSDPNVSVISSRLKRGFLFMVERLRILFGNGFNREKLFKVSTADISIGITSHPLVKEADVVVLSWINQGLVSLGDLRKLAEMGKPVVWTMHDMWCMTGICHHAIECKNFIGECGNCMYLGSKASPGDMSHRIWKKKKEIYSATPIQFVAVSNWLKEQAMKSSLLKDQKVEVIPNAFPIESFITECGENTMILNPETKYIVVGAARLDDTIKGLPYAIEALNILFDEHPEIANTTEALFFGNLRDEDALTDLRFPYRYLGPIKDPTLLRRLYASSKVVLSSSLFETLPGTLIEGQASGCLPVTFDRGGQRDIIDHLRNGYIARFGDVRDMVAGIKWALLTDVDRNALHNEVGERFGSEIIARRYIDLFHKLLEDRK